MFNSNLRFVPLSDVLTGAELYLPMSTSVPDTDKSSLFLNIRKFKLISRNSKYADLYSLWKNYPEYFQKLLELEPYSRFNKFKPDGNPSDFAKRFEVGYVPKRRKEREKYVQISIFDYLFDR